MPGGPAWRQPVWRLSRNLALRPGGVASALRERPHGDAGNDRARGRRRTGGVPRLHRSTRDSARGALGRAARPDTPPWPVLDLFADRGRERPVDLRADGRRSILRSADAISPAFRL